jgi:hypothetical protein
MWLAREIEPAACGRFDGDVVRATLPFDIELFNLERLRVPDARRGNACWKRIEVTIWTIRQYSTSAPVKTYFDWSPTHSRSHPVYLSQVSK